MGLKKLIFNPLSAQFDYISEEMTVVSGAPDSGIEGVMYQDSTSPTDVYYFSGSNRYKITAVLNNPSGSGGSFLFADSSGFNFADGTPINYIT